MSRWSGMVALACLLAGMTTSIAQNSNDHPQTFGATAQAAARPAQQSGPDHVYSVAGLSLGSRVQFDSADYREYKCSPSEQFAGYTWCQKTRQEKDRRGSLNVTYSLLHSQDGTVFYVNRFQEPAFFGPNEADAAIRQYSSKIGEKAEIKRLPRQQGRPEGTLATWGKVVLEPLDSGQPQHGGGRKKPEGWISCRFYRRLCAVSQGGTSDLSRHWRRRVRLGCELRSKRSRYSSAYGNRPITTHFKSASKRNADQYRPELPNRTRRQHQHRQRKAPNQIPMLPVSLKTPQNCRNPMRRITPPETASGTQVANNQIERLSAESAKLNAAVRQLETEKAAAEGKAHRMESVAYGSGVIALLAIVSSIFFASRKKAVTVEPQRTTPETKPPDVTGHSPVVEIQPTSDAPPTKPSDPDSASLEMSSKPDANTAETIETGVSEARRLPIEMLQKSE